MPPEDVPAARNEANFTAPAPPGPPPPRALAMAPGKLFDLFGIRYRLAGPIRASPDSFRSTRLYLKRLVFRISSLPIAFSSRKMKPE